MDNRLMEIAEKTKQEFGLEHYYLGRHGIYKRFNDKEQTEYLFSMEWFPNESEEAIEEDENPPGTASIEYNIQREQYDSVIFVMQTTYATKAPFQNRTIEEIAEWVKRYTGLEVNQELRLTEAYEDGFLFKGELGGVPLSPNVVIEVKFNEAGQLLQYSKMGDFPNTYEVAQAEFSLTLEEIEPIVKQQLQLVTIPSETEERFVPVYAVEEVFVTVDGKKIIPFLVDERKQHMVDEVMVWETPLTEELHQEPIFLNSEVEVEEAFGKTVAVEYRLNSEAEEKTKKIVRDVLRTLVPEESGQWIMKTMEQSGNLIISKCHRVGENLAFFNRRIVVITEAGTNRLLNYMDNSEMLAGLFEKFQLAGEPVVTEQEAFEKMMPYISLQPKYVFDPAEGRYILCGLLDAEECVDAVTGEIRLLGDL